MGTVDRKPYRSSYVESLKADMADAARKGDKVLEKVLRDRIDRIVRASHETR